MASSSYIFLTSDRSEVEQPELNRLELVQPELAWPGHAAWAVYLFRWMPLVMMLGVLYMESTAMMGADRTSGHLHSWMHAMTGSSSGLDRHWPMIHHLIRKTGHFLGYGVLSLAWLRGMLLSLRQCGGWTKWNGAWRIQTAAVAATFSVAALDEFHQTFLPNRTGTFRDVLLDTAGAIVAQMVLRAGLLLLEAIRAERGRVGANRAERIAA